jgi:4'-phosphopantetheinyl transferase
MAAPRHAVAPDISAPAAPPSASVDVWIAEVGAYTASEPALRNELDDTECARAARFRFARDRTQYVVAHGLLRRLLGEYTGRRAASLRFSLGPCGKPALMTEAGDDGAVTFSLSHSGERIAIAVARDRAVGVDVERWSDDIVYDELAEFCFSRAERAALAALPAERKQRAFFAAWTRKEAYIKALGVGVSRGLDYFDVSLAPGEPARLLDDRLAPGSAASWTMSDLDLDDGYSGAVMVQGAACRLECRTLTPDTESTR